MKSLFRASILGLGHSEVVSLRQHVAAILTGVDIDWVGANHEHLDFLIVNSNFINASSVQNLLRSNSLPVLLASHASDMSVADQHSIQLPLLENTPLKKWIHECVLGDRMISTSPIKSKEYVITQVLLDNTKIFEYLRTSNDGFLHLSDRCGAVGIVDTNNQLMYLLPERRVPVDMQGSLAYERVTHLPKTYQSVDLLQWLWDVAWFAPSCSLLVPPDQLIKLRFWPQPARAEDRRDVLLMSAKVAQSTISAQDLALSLNIPVLRTQHFMSASVMGGFGEVQTQISQKAAVAPEKAVNSTDATGLRRLLLGVRRRLGL